MDSSGHGAPHGVVCPSCGVAVVAGYVRCPKCKATLPSTRIGVISDPGGTSLAPDRPPFPIVSLLIAAVVAGGIAAAVIVLGRHTRGPATAAAAASAPPPAADRPAGSAPAEATSAPRSAATPAAGPQRDAVLLGLERALKGKRLWATVSADHDRVEIRSALCGDKAFAPTVAAATGDLAAAGFVQVKCLALSGQVLFARDL